MNYWGEHSVGVIPTARSSQERGHDGPQLLNAVPGTSEHGATENNTVKILTKHQNSSQSQSQPLSTHQDSGQCYSWWPQSPAPHNICHRLLEWDYHAISSGFAPPAARLGALRPVTPLTPATIAWNIPQAHDDINQGIKRCWNYSSKY